MNGCAWKHEPPGSRGEKPGWGETGCAASVPLRWPTLEAKRLLPMPKSPWNLPSPAREPGLGMLWLLGLALKSQQLTRHGWQVCSIDHYQQ